MQSVVDLSRQIGAQGEADGQATAAVDVPHPAGDAHLPGHVDFERAADRRGYFRPLGPPLQTVHLQLVGSQPRHWSVPLFYASLSA